MRDRRTITVQGVVQGVGFRPFVYRLASRLGLGGTVRNDTTGVVIDAEGEAASLETFLQALVAEAPPLARIERVAAEGKAVRHYASFASEPSGVQDETDVFISPDSATCPACLRELADPHARRCHYPFLNCTHCGPRFTIIIAVPYDRERTTMAGFTWCRQCWRPAPRFIACVIPRGAAWRPGSMRLPDARRWGSSSTKSASPSARM